MKAIVRVDFPRLATEARIQNLIEILTVSFKAVDVNVEFRQRSGTKSLTAEFATYQDRNRALSYIENETSYKGRTE